MLDVEKKKEFVSRCIDKGFLVSKDALDDCVDAPEHFKDSKCLILNKDSIKIKNITGYNWIEFDKAKVLFEKKRNKKILESFIKDIDDSKFDKVVEINDESVKILYSYEDNNTKKKQVSDFVKYFNKRYSAIEQILKKRQELTGVVSISRVLGRTDRESVSIIGIVLEKRYSKNGHIMLTLEDKTGFIKVLISKDKPEMFNEAKDVVLDEIIGVTGFNGDKIIFANNILWPDIPAHKEVKKAKEELYAIFMSDMHVGSTYFLPDEFNKFLKWINCETGSQKQKNTAKKVKYIFILGDLVDGVGIYPGQDKELTITDIYEQYKECARLLSKIPEHIKIIICPGNHDAMRIAEPQPKLYEDFSNPVLELPNTSIVSNPSIVNFHSSDDFPGFDVLLYHGYSFDYYVANVDSIRSQGGYDRADLIMKFLLKRRHLAPSHTSTLYIPDNTGDPLVIKKVPDFFATGHIHNTPVVSFYRGVNTISCGCWQAKTSFQEKVGHNPGPCKIPLVNLQTRQVKILRFQ